MATPQAPGITSTTSQDTPTVMVVGKSGMGKSTLCNYLLYGSPRPDEGFSVSSGAEPITAACASKFVASTRAPRSMQPTEPGGPLTLIDTPGIPDPNMRTLEAYNDIVMAARNSDGINALIIAVHYDADRQLILNDFGTYKILLKQFARLPCLKILLCRVRLQVDFTEAQQQAELAPVTAWMDNIQASGGMEGASKVILLDNDRQAAQIFALRQVVCEAPKVSIPDWTIRTHPELVENVQALSTEQSRMAALREKKTCLEQEKRQLVLLNTELRSRSLRAETVGSFLSALIIAGGFVGDVSTGLASAGTITATSVVLAGATKKACSDVARGFSLMIKTNDHKQSNLVNEVSHCKPSTECHVHYMSFHARPKPDFIYGCMYVYPATLPGFVSAAHNIPSHEVPFNLQATISIQRNQKVGVDDL